MSSPRSPVPVAPPLGREPRQERGRATRQALIEAAIACIDEQGWSGTTVGLIAERAGMSRGAAQHYFPTRAELVGAMMEHLSERQIGLLRARVAALPAGSRRAETVVAMLLELYTGQTFRTALHMWVAAATDDGLRDIVVRLQAQVGREAHRTAVELLGADESVPGVRELVQATLDLARGLGLANLLADDAERRSQIAAQWASVLSAAW